MSEAVERLRAANRYEMKLENGIPITYRLPFMEELVVAGLLPLDMLEQLRTRLEEGGTQVEAESVAEESMQERLADYATDFEAKQRVVALMVVSVDGEAAQLAPTDTVELPNPDFQRLIRIALRNEVPGAAEAAE